MKNKIKPVAIHRDGTLQYAFCPTGSGGGVDNSCGKGGSSGDKPLGFDGEPASHFAMTKLSSDEKKQAVDLVKGWQAEYAAKGSDARLPNDYIEETNPKMFDKMSDVLSAAWYESSVDAVAKDPEIGTVQEFMENSQGYHDEQVDTMNKALELLK